MNVDKFILIIVPLSLTNYPLNNKHDEEYHGDQIWQQTRYGFIHKWHHAAGCLYMSDKSKIRVSEGWQIRKCEVCESIT